MTKSLLQNRSRSQYLSSSTSTGLLVSVRNVVETGAALQGGADWIDLKEPSAGSLGAVSLATALEVSQMVRDRRPLSAALGELKDWPNVASQALLEVPGICYVKLGLAGMNSDDQWKERWRAVDQQISNAGKCLVAVAYADWQRTQAPTPSDLMTLAENSYAKTMLIDTYDKQQPGTLQQLGLAELRNLATAAKRKGIAVVMAGKLKKNEIRDLPLEQIALVAVRGAVCRADRTTRVESTLVAQFKHDLIGCLPRRCTKIHP